MLSVNVKTLYALDTTHTKRTPDAPLCRFVTIWHHCDISLCATSGEYSDSYQLHIPYYHKIGPQLHAHLFTDISSTFLPVAKWKQIFVQCKVASSACERLLFHVLCVLLMSRREGENWIAGVWVILGRMTVQQVGAAGVTAVCGDAFGSRDCNSALVC
jgi:hypothetical protein